MTGPIRNIMIVIVTAASVLLCAIVWFFVRESRGIRVGTAVVSKTLCSGVFVSGLDPDLLYAEAVKPNPGQTQLAKRLRYQVDRTARQVIATWAGRFESRAVYRDGFGCVLVHGDTAQGAALSKSATVLATEQAESLELKTRSPQLEAALDRAFAEPAQPPYRWVKAIAILHDGKLVAAFTPGCPRMRSMVPGILASGSWCFLRRS